VSVVVPHKDARPELVRDSVRLGEDIANDTGKTTTRVVTVWRKYIAAREEGQAITKARNTKSSMILRDRPTRIVREGQGTVETG